MPKTLGMWDPSILSSIDLKPFFPCFLEPLPWINTLRVHHTPSAVHTPGSEGIHRSWISPEGPLRYWDDCRWKKNEAAHWPGAFICFLFLGLINNA